jgi:hypothetical protein
MDLNLAVAIVALIAATAALIRQRRDADRQTAYEKVSDDRELTHRHNEAEVLQEQLLGRIEFLIYKYLRLQERIAALLPKCVNPVDKDRLDEQRDRVGSRLQDLQRSYADGRAAVVQLRDKQFAADKDLNYFDKLIETTRAALSAIDSGGAKDLVVDLENEIAEIEKRLR